MWNKQLQSIDFNISYFYFFSGKKVNDVEHQAYSQNLVPTLFFLIIFHWLFQINQQMAESNSTQNFASGSI